MGELIRASDAERQAATDRLSAAVEQGRLSLEEFTDRLDAALAATHRHQLERLTADLPTNTDTGLDSVPVREMRVFGDIRRRGAWPIPAEGKWRTLFGDVILDLREARVTAPVVHIDADTVFGDVEVLVPDGVLVEVRSHSLFGDIRQHAGEAALPGAPRIILTGRCLFGDVRIRSHRLREVWWRKWLALPERDE